MEGGLFSVIKNILRGWEKAVLPRGVGLLEVGFLVQGHQIGVR